MLCGVCSLSVACWLIINGFARPYDAQEHGTIVVHLPKKEPGQEFEDLDMLTKLLQPKEPKIDLKLDAQKYVHAFTSASYVFLAWFSHVACSCRKAPLIEVLNSSVSADAEDGASSTDSTAVPAGQPLLTKPASASLLGLEERIAALPEEPESTVRITDLKPTYGFNNAYSDFFRVWHGEISEILSLPDPEHTPADQRRVLREAAEDEQFDIERYLLDFINKDDDMYYQLAMEYEPFWRQHPVVKVAAPVQAVEVVTPKKSPLIMEVVSSTTGSEQVAAQMNALELNGDAPQQPAASLFSDADRELLLRLPHKEYLIARGSKEEAVILGGLADILVGFTYDHLTSQGDSGIESTWAVSIVSPTLAWLDTTSDLKAVVRTAVRRILSFPFLRQYELAMHVLRETVALLKRGKRVVLKALLELHRVVEKSETQYLLNTLYVQDYCVWVQSLQDAQLLGLSEQLAKHIDAFKKEDSGWALEEIERSLLEADDVAEEQEEEESSSEESSSDEEEDSSSEDEDENEATKVTTVAT